MDKYRLCKAIEKKFETTIIGALSEFERYFGNLWGMDKQNKSELTVDESVMEAKWQKCRKEILDKGNAQKRNTLQVLDLYNIERAGNKMSFVTPDNIGNTR